MVETETQWRGFSSTACTYMAFERHAARDRGVAGAEVGGDAHPLLQRGTIGVIDDHDLLTERLLHLRGPIAAAAAAGIAVHRNAVGRHRGRGDEQRGGEERMKLRRPGLGRRSWLR